MKMYMYLIIALILPILSVAQESRDTSLVDNETIVVIEDKSDQDSSVRISIGGVKVIIDDNNKITISTRSKDSTSENSENSKKSCRKNNINFLGGWDLGILFISPITNSASNKYYSDLDILGKSIDVHWYLVRQRLKMSKNFSFLWGLDFNWKNYRLDNNLIFMKDPSNGRYDAFSDTTVYYSKDKLMARYISLPILLEVHSAKLRSWKAYGIAFGASFSQLVGARQKLISSEFGKQKKNSSSYAFSPQRIDLIARLTIGRIVLTGSFGMTPLFENDGIKFQPNYTPYNLGIKLCGL